MQTLLLCRHMKFKQLEDKFLQCFSLTCHLFCIQFFSSPDAMVSTQTPCSSNDLNPTNLDMIFSNITSSSRDTVKSDSSISVKKLSSKFVKNSGLVLYATSESESVSSDDSVDIENDSPPDSPVFKIPPRTAQAPDKPSRFHQASTKSELQFLSGKTFAKSTDRKILWAANLFCIWRQNRIDEGTGEGEILWCDLDRDDLDPEVLAHVSPTFINEIKCVNGEDYPPNTVYSIIVMLQLFLRRKERHGSCSMERNSSLSGTLLTTL